MVSVKHGNFLTNKQGVDGKVTSSILCTCELCLPLKCLNDMKKTTSKEVNEVVATA
jgi:hypothetical protein